MATFPNDRLPGKQHDAVLYTDMKLTAKAPIVDLGSGQLIPGSQIAVGADGLWPYFTSAAPVLYYRNTAGLTVSMVPSIGAAGVVTVTGSRGGNAALASLLTALAASGIPIIDGTSA